eukprot:317242-Prymnesium_polylepis.1
MRRREKRRDRLRARYARPCTTHPRCRSRRRARSLGLAHVGWCGALPLPFLWPPSSEQPPFPLSRFGSD